MRVVGSFYILFFLLVALLGHSDVKAQRNPNEVCAAWNYFPDGLSSACGIDTVTYSVTPWFNPPWGDPSITGYEYAWHVEGGNAISTDGGPSMDVAWNSPYGRIWVTIYVDHDPDDGHPLPWYECHTSLKKDVTYFSVATSPAGDVEACAPFTIYALPSNHIYTTYQWKKNGADIPGATRSFCPIDDDGTYAVVATQGSCVELSSSVDVTFKDVPSMFNLTSDSYICNWGVGATFTLIGSEPDVTYYLDNGTLHFPQSRTDSGNIEWKDVTLFGTITVLANKDGCVRTMGNSYQINELSVPPIIFFTEGGGVYCAGESGVTVTLSSSQLGVKYRLRYNTTPTGDTLFGTGGRLTFPLKTSVGSYAITAEYPDAGCSVDNPTLMSGTAMIGTTPAPSSFTLNADDFCEGTNKGKITIRPSQPGIQYQLYKKGVTWGKPETASDSVLIIKNLSAGGPYSIVARNPTTKCATIATGPVIQRWLPEIFSVSGGGAVCNGDSTSIILNGSDSVVRYQLRKNGEDVGLSVPGTGSELTWQGIAEIGTYTIMATSTKLDGCFRLMNDSVRVQNGPTILMSVTRYSCAYHFSPSVTKYNNCHITSVNWDFDDNTTSTELDPFHTYEPGTYTLEMEVTSNCGGVTCTTTVSRSIIVEEYEFNEINLSVPTVKRAGVLNTSVSTFSDSWPLPFELQSHSGKNPFTNGQRGVWRNESQYAYKAPRLQSNPVNLAADGTFTIETFNWQLASLGAIPNWINANTVTRYNPYGFELENRDVIGISSAALYDYGGHLMTAQGDNMRNNETAFTGFEYLEGKTTGNWTFGTEDTQVFKLLKLVSGYGNSGIIEANSEQLSGFTALDVIANHFWSLGFFGGKIISNNGIICATPHSENEDNTAVVFREAPFPESWEGYVFHRRQEASDAPATIDTVAHTGRSSLKITSTQKFSQHQLNLDSAKRYVISAWASINNPNLTTPVLGTNIGFDIIIRDQENLAIDTITFVPQGPLVEGWQQIKGIFTVPIVDAKIEIAFRSGSAGTVWFDDLRLHPDKGMMKSYVYDLKDYRLSAILDEQNFASFFYYDDEGNLFLTKKETERGRKTISENSTHMKQN